MSINLYPANFSRLISNELLRTAPEQDLHIKELAKLILQTNFKPQKNIDIRYIRDNTRITAKFSQLGEITYLGRSDKSAFQQGNYKIDVPEHETPGTSAKYEFILISSSPKENRFDFQRRVTVQTEVNYAPFLLGAVALAAISGIASTICPAASQLVMIPIATVVAPFAAVATAITAAAAPIIMAGAVMTMAAAPIIMAGAVMTMAVAPIIVAGVIISVAAAPFALLNATFRTISL